MNPKNLDKADELREQLRELHYIEINYKQGCVNIPERVHLRFAELLKQCRAEIFAEVEKL